MLEEKPLRSTFSGYSNRDSLVNQRCFHDDDLTVDDCYNCRKVLVSSFADGLGVHRAWKHVLTRSSGSHLETSRLYKEAVARVEYKARGVYEEDSRHRDEFLQVMVENGSFILQVALCSFVGPKPLGYPAQDPIFGEIGYNKERMRFWVISLFSVQNQIPFMVLKVLMKQSFFQNVLKLGKWKRPNDLARMALYDFLIKPMMLGNPVKQGNSMRERFIGFLNKRMMSRWHQEQEPTTSLHALWLLLTGSVSRDVNPIHEEDDQDHLYTTLSTIRCATELQAAGIIFRSEEGMGTRQIKFKQTMLEAHLYLPCIYMDYHTITLFQNLIDYEAAVGLNLNRREVSAYLSFMKELIRSSNDVGVLVTQGIIDTDPDFEEQLVDALARLRPLEVGSSHNLGAIRRQIRRYVKPSIRPKIMYLVLIGLVLTMVQTIYGALSYHQSHSMRITRRWMRGEDREERIFILATLDKLTSSSLQDFRSMRNVNEEQSELPNTLKRIEVILSFAEKT